MGSFKKTIHAGKYSFECGRLCEHTAVLDSIATAFCLINQSRGLNQNHSTCHMCSFTSIINHFSCIFCCWLISTRVFSGFGARRFGMVSIPGGFFLWKGIWGKPVGPKPPNYHELMAYLPRDPIKNQPFMWKKSVESAFSSTKIA